MGLRTPAITANARPSRVGVSGRYPIIPPIRPLVLQVFFHHPFILAPDLFSQELFGKLASKHFSSNLPLLEQYTSLVSRLLCGSKRTQFFTRQGFEKFSKHGIGSGTSQMIFPPLEENERLEALQYFSDTYE